MNKYLDPKYLFLHITSIKNNDGSSLLKRQAIQSKMFFKNDKPDIYKYIVNALEFKFDMFYIYNNSIFGWMLTKPSKKGFYEFSSKKWTERYLGTIKMDLLSILEMMPEIEKQK